MRAEKQYLVAEVETHLKKSDYVILTNFNGVNVADVAVLRAELRKENAEFHVVKNSSLRVAAKAMGLPEFEDSLSGPTAIIVGGDNSPGVAKIVTDFFKSKKKVEVKAAVLSQKLLSAEDVNALAALPSLDALRAQLLGLINQPGTMLVRVLNAIPQSVVNVLQAKIRDAEES